MYPVLFQIGDLSFFTYGIVTSLGFLIAVSVFIRKALRRKIPLEFISDHFLSLVFWSLVGARAAHVLRHMEYYAKDYLQIVYFWESGYLLWGGVLGFLGAFTYHTWRQKESIKKWIDIIVPSAIVGLIFENAASLLDGSRYGSPTELKWGITFENLEVPFTIPVHPIQLYLILVLLGTGILSATLRRRQKRRTKENEDTESPQDGLIGLIDLAIITAAYTAVGFLDASEEQFLFQLHLSQLLQILLFIISVAGILSYRKKESLYLHHE